MFGTVSTSIRLMQQFGVAAFARGVYHTVRGTLPLPGEVSVDHELPDAPRDASSCLIQSHGAEFLVRPSSTDHAIIEETWNVYMERLRARGLCDFDNVIDLGAQIGGFAIHLALNANVRGQIVAVEPEPENYKLLCDN